MENPWCKNLRNKFTANSNEQKSSSIPCLVQWTRSLVSLTASTHVSFWSVCSCWVCCSKCIHILRSEYGQHGSRCVVSTASHCDWCMHTCCMCRLAFLSSSCVAGALESDVCSCRLLVCTPCCMMGTCTSSWHNGSWHADSNGTSTCTCTRTICSESCHQHFSVDISGFFLSLEPASFSPLGVMLPGMCLRHCPPLHFVRQLHPNCPSVCQLVSAVVFSSSQVH